MREGDTYHLDSDALINRTDYIIKNVFGDYYKLKFIYDISADLLTYFNFIQYHEIGWIHKCWKSRVFTDLKGNAEVSIDAKLDDIRVSIARYIVSAKERKTFLLPVSFLRGNAILRVSVENIPGKLDSDLGCDQLFPLEDNGIENREIRDEADSLITSFQ